MVLLWATVLSQYFNMSQILSFEEKHIDLLNGYRCWILKRSMSSTFASFLYTVLKTTRIGFFIFLYHLFWNMVTDAGGYLHLISNLFVSSKINSNYTQTLFSWLEYRVRICVLYNSDDNICGKKAQWLNETRFIVVL